MSSAFLAVPAALFVLAFTLPAAAQTTSSTTKSASELAKENAELRAYADKLEARVAELERALKSRQSESAPRPRAESRPLTPAPYGYQLPQFPFNLPAPAPTPPRADNLRVLPAPSQPIPDTWRRHEFNGQEYYLVPLR